MASVTENSAVDVAFTPLGVNIRIGQCNLNKKILYYYYYYNYKRLNIVKSACV